jgi:hypothetical protein
MRKAESIFGDWVIPKDLWLTSSPALTLPHFTAGVYRNKTHMNYDLKENIR